MPGRRGARQRREHLRCAAVSWPSGSWSRARSGWCRLGRSRSARRAAPASGRGFHEGRWPAARCRIEQHERCRASP